MPSFTGSTNPIVVDRNRLPGLDAFEVRVVTTLSRVFTTLNILFQQSLYILFPIGAAMVFDWELHMLPSSQNLLKPLTESVGRMMQKPNFEKGEF